MAIPNRTSPTPMEHAAPYGLPKVNENTDDPLTLLYVYQQHMRAELLGATTERANRSGVRWWRLWKTPSGLHLLATTVGAIEGRVRALTDAGVSYAYRQAVSLGGGAR